MNPLAGIPQRGSDPCASGFAIAPSDTVNLAVYTRYLHVSVAGTVTVDFVNGGSNISLGTLPIGTYPLSVSRVYSTGTSATLVGLY
jgi:hypothetical protein